MAAQTQAPTTPFLQSPGIRTFLTIWFGQLISTIGSSLTAFALGVYVYETTGSKTLFALINICFMLPQIVVTPFAGALVDRIDRRWAMIISDTGAGLSTAAVVLLHLTGHLQIWHILIATLVNSSFNTIQWPAWSAAQTLIVPKEHLGRAGGMVQIGDAMGQLFAPALAGILYVTIRLSGVVAIDFATFVFAALTLLAVRLPRPEQSAAGQQAKKASFLSDASFGFRFIWLRKPLLALLIYFAVQNLLGGGLGSLLSPLLLDISGPQTVGLLYSIVGLGMLFGTLFMSWWGGPQRKVRGVLIFGALGGVANILLGVRMSLPLMTVAGFAMLFMMPILNACSQAIWQRKVEPDVQGRVFSARRVIAWCTTIPGAIIGPLVVDGWLDPLTAANGSLAGTPLGSLLTLGPGRGAGVYFMITGALTVVAASVAFLIPLIRNIETLLPDTVPDTPRVASAEAAPELAPQAEPEVVPAGS